MSARPEKQRRAIQAAASVFAAKGYHGASTGDIAGALGIRQGSLYYYFASKEDALAAVCLYGIEAYVSRMEEIAASTQPFEAKLFAVLMSHLSSYRERDEALKVHNDERLYLPVEKRAELKKLGSHYRQMLEEIFREGIRQNVLRPEIEPHFAAQTVISLCNGWGDLLVRDADIDVVQLAQRCQALLLDGCRQ